LTNKFRGGLGGVALEVFSVVLGVLVALGVDGWSADRALQRRADRAQAAIMAEVRANMVELDNALTSLETAAEQGPFKAAAAGDAGLAPLGERDAQTGSGGKALALEAPRAGTLDLTLPEFSRAAWQTSQMTDATVRLDFDWLIMVAKAYETQALYSELSIDVVRSVAELGTANQKAVANRMSGQLSVLLDVHRALVETYRTILAAGGV
jgi:hypothetical protein